MLVGQATYCLSHLPRPKRHAKRYKVVLNASTPAFYYVHIETSGSRITLEQKYWNWPNDLTRVQGLRVKLRCAPVTQECWNRILPSQAHYVIKVSPAFKGWQEQSPGFPYHGLTGTEAPSLSRWGHRLPHGRLAGTEVASPLTYWYRTAPSVLSLREWQYSLSSEDI